ncbi:MAG: response regulator [Ktedonobacterales bacterium]
MEDIAVRKAHLLIVEDSAEIRETLELVLTEEGYKVSLAPDLSRAFALVSEQTFDLVLTDLFTFSQVDPLQSVSQLRTRVAPTPIGVISGWQVDPEYAKRQGFAFLLTKPFELEDLLACVATCLAT